METALSYSGSLRRRYIEAARSLESDGLSGFHDYFLRAFLKSEKNRSPGKMAKPRLIFPRSPRFNLELASRLKPFEHWIWGRLTGKILGCGDGSRLVAKGLNPVARANLIIRKFNAIPQCVCFEIDGAAFEAHVGPAQLAGEAATYRAAFPGDRRLRWLLRCQSELLGEVSDAKFRRPGGRASGDYNTGMGNSLVFVVECASALRSLGVHYDMLADGDNALLFVSQRDVDYVVSRLPGLITQSSGHEITLERPTSVLEQIRFGGSAPVFLGQELGWRMVRDWNRVLSGAFSSHIHLNEPKFAKRWMKGVAMCEMSLARGVPVLQAWAVGALRALGGQKVAKEAFYRDYFALGATMVGSDSATTVSCEARLSFERAFGLSPDLQVAFEQSLSFESLDHPEEVFRPKRFSHWLEEVGVHESWRAC